MRRGRRKRRTKQTPTVLWLLHVDSVHDGRVKAEVITTKKALKIYSDKLDQ